MPRVAAPHGKLFAAIVVGGAAFGASSCYLSHTLDDDAGTVVDARVDAPLRRDAGHDAGSDAGTDAGADAGLCPPPLSDGRPDCVACSAGMLCFMHPECACSAFCCFI